MHGDKFPEDVIVARFEARRLAAVLHVLRFEADGRPGENPVALADSGGPAEHDVRHHFTVIAEFHPLLDHRIGTDGDTARKLSSRVDDGCGVSFHEPGRSETANTTTASATSFPSTSARPAILPKLPLERRLSTSISMRNWSPGTTGRRNFALSMPVK